MHKDKQSLCVIYNAMEYKLYNVVKNSNELAFEVINRWRMLYEGEIKNFVYIHLSMYTCHMGFILFLFIKLKGVCHVWPNLNSSPCIITNKKFIYQTENSYKLFLVKINKLSP